MSPAETSLLSLRHPPVAIASVAGERWQRLAGLPLRVAVHIPLCKLTLQQLSRLEPGQLLCGSWAVVEDVPVRAGEALLGWAEFEEVDGRMAMRLTQMG